MLKSIVLPGSQDPVSQDQIVRLAEGRLEASERRQIVRRLVAQAARNQVTPGLDPFPGKPVPEGTYDLAMNRAFERACRLHKRLGGVEEEDMEVEDAGQEFDLLVPVGSGYSASAPSGRRA